MIRQRPQRALGPADSRNPIPRRRHGLSAVELRLLLDAQGSRCPGCGAEITAVGAAVVDHDHSLALQHGHPVDRGCHRCRRQLLCNACNVALGMVRDDPDRLRRLADYVEHWRAQLGGPKAAIR